MSIQSMQYELTTKKAIKLEIIILHVGKGLATASEYNNNALLLNVIYSYTIKSHAHALTARYTIIMIVSSYDSCQ